VCDLLCARVTARNNSVILKSTGGATEALHWTEIFSGTRTRAAMPVRGGVSNSIADWAWSLPGSEMLICWPARGDVFQESRAVFCLISGAAGSGGSQCKPALGRGGVFHYSIAVLSWKFNFSRQGEGSSRGAPFGACSTAMRRRSPSRFSFLN